MNGSMIEHDGLGITFFSVDILKDLSIEVIMLKLDYCFESFTSPNVHAIQRKKEYDEHVRQHSTSKILFSSFTYSRTSRN